MSQPYRVLFVCLGNICRSPAAEAVFAHRAHTHGLAGLVEVDSAGTGSWHVGEGAHAMSRQVGVARGYALDAHVVRQVQAGDFHTFDLVVPMDRSNRADLRSLAPSGSPAVVCLLRAFDPHGGPDEEVPDPWGKPKEAFEHMYDLIERSSDGLVDHVRRLIGR